ncbi:COL8A [Mytilus coruscus]|uniref:COL8A n=1 Tax=Mytilus coruscus TaxID=42192 RepID=A0A6J8EBY7_MYTCO|nr:COL8A [Mytilus coruscus]
MDLSAGITMMFKNYERFSCDKHLQKNWMEIFNSILKADSVKTKLLLEKQSDVNIKTNLKTTVLMLICKTFPASKEDDVYSLALYLLNRGANVDEVDVFGKTTIHYSESHGFSKTTKLLLSYTLIHQFNLCSNRETTPAFSSVLTHAQSVTANAAIKFDRVVVNIKDGYDLTTGIFTAPSFGVFHISSTVMNSEGQRLCVSLYLNYVKMTSIWLSPASQTYEMGTTNMVLDLKEGDKVSIRSRGSYTVHSNRNIYSSFSGYLIMN